MANSSVKSWLIIFRVQAQDPASLFQQPGQHPSRIRALKLGLRNQLLRVSRAKQRLLLQVRRLKMPIQPPEPILLQAAQLRPLQEHLKLLMEQHELLGLPAKPLELACFSHVFTRSCKNCTSLELESLSETFHQQHKISPAIFLNLFPLSRCVKW